MFRHLCSDLSCTHSTSIQLHQTHSCASIQFSHCGPGLILAIEDDFAGACAEVDPDGVEHGMEFELLD